MIGLENITEKQGHRLRSIRVHFEMSQEDFAKRLGVAQTYISKIENTSVISGKIITQINIIFNEVNTNWLLTGQGNMLKSVEKLEPPIAEQGIKQVANGNGGHVSQSTQGAAPNDLYERLLKEKDMRIELLEKQISELKDIVTELKRQLK